MYRCYVAVPTNWAADHADRDAWSRQLRKRHAARRFHVCRARCCDCPSGMQTWSGGSRGMPQPQAARPLQHMLILLVKSRYDTNVQAQTLGACYAESCICKLMYCPMCMHYAYTIRKGCMRVVTHNCRCLDVELHGWHAGMTDDIYHCSMGEMRRVSERISCQHSLASLHTCCSRGKDAHIFPWWGIAHVQSEPTSL